MSLTIRSAKSGSDWTSNDLNAYNITVVRNQSAKAFFGKELPGVSECLAKEVDPAFVNGTAACDAANDSTHRLLMYLDLAAKANPGQASAIDDFAKELLRTLGFEERDCVLRSRYAIPLHICGETTRTAPSEMCLVHRATTILLLVQQDATGSAKDPEPQIIAAAVAAFQMNNRNRGRLGMDKKASMSIPCITMVGTRPIFYVVPVTQQLSTAVERGEHPEHQTEVKKRVVVGEMRRLTEGMEKANFRLEALKHYILFRSLCKNLWSEFVTN